MKYCFLLIYLIISYTLLADSINPVDSLKVDSTFIAVDSLTVKSTLDTKKDSLAFDDGKLLFISGYSILSLAYYGLAIPYSHPVLEDRRVPAYVFSNALLIGTLQKQFLSKKIHYKDVSFSLNMASRGILHGNALYYLLSHNEYNDEKVVLCSSLLSGLEAYSAYQLSFNQKLTLSQSNAIPLYHDVEVMNAASLMYSLDAYKRWNDDVKLGIGLLSAVKGIQRGYIQGNKIDYTKGDAHFAHFNYLIGGAIGYLTADVFEFNQTLTGLSIYFCSNAGLLYGEYNARKYQISKSEANKYFIVALGAGISLVGFAEGDKEQAYKNILTGAIISYAFMEIYPGKGYQRKNQPNFSFDYNINPFAFNSDTPIFNYSIKF